MNAMKNNTNADQTNGNAKISPQIFHHFKSSFKKNGSIFRGVSVYAFTDLKLFSHAHGVLCSMKKKRKREAEFVGMCICLFKLRVDFFHKLFCTYTKSFAFCAMFTYFVTLRLPLFRIILHNLQIYSSLIFPVECRKQQ